MPRCELAELQADYRKLFRVTHRVSTETLTWHVPGTVWATDHCHPPQAIDGIYSAVLAVRDLASGMELAWQPVLDETAATTKAVLSPLIDEYGPPLVIKSDNGPAFKSAELARLLSERRIVWLPSPPRTPWYNGSCEAGNGRMKTGTNFFAALAGHPGYWTSECLEKARRQANELTRPQGPTGPTHADRWASRPAIAQKQRDQLETMIRGNQTRIIDTMPQFCTNNRNHQHKVLRQAVRRALLDAGLLTITRRSITPPINRRFSAKIS